MVVQFHPLQDGFARLFLLLYHFRGVTKMVIHVFFPITQQQITTPTSNRPFFTISFWFHAVFLPLIYLSVTQVILCLKPFFVSFKAGISPQKIISSLSGSHVFAFILDSPVISTRSISSPGSYQDKGFSDK